MAIETIVRQMLLSCILLSLSVLAQQNQTEPEIKHGIVREPRGRGTFSVVYTSLVTLSLCAHTAVHPNTIGDQKRFERITQKIRLVFCALFFPERVLMTAYCQWSEAKHLIKVWNEEVENNKRSPPAQETIMLKDRGEKALPLRYASKNRVALKNRIGNDVACYIVMGGYALRSNETNSVFPAVLTPQGLLDLVHAGIIKEEAIVEKDILDKGNTDAFAKTVVCIQALWMLVQCAVRAFIHLPLTILEVHAVMHILCAAGMYWFWWNKPLDVNEPIIMMSDQPELAKILSVACDDFHMFDFRIERNPKIELGTRTKDDTTINIREDYPEYDTTDETITVAPITNNNASKTPESPPKRYFLESSGEKVLIEKPFDTIIFFHHNGNGDYPIPLGEPSRYSPYKHWGTFKGQKEDFCKKLGREEPGTITVFHGERIIRENSFSIECNLGIGHEDRRTFLRKVDLDMLQDVAEAVRTGKYDTHYTDESTQGQKLRKLYSDTLVYPPLDLGVRDRLRLRIGDWWIAELKWIIDSQYKFRMLIALFILYGAGHAAAWNNYFPTPLERWSWRASCVIVAASPLAFYINYQLCLWLKERSEKKQPDPEHGHAQSTTKLAQTIKRPAQMDEPKRPMLRQRPSWRKVEKNLHIWHSKRSAYFWGFIFFVFTIARVFMTVEAFVALRSLPNDVYKTAGWEGFWPHAG